MVHHPYQRMKNILYVFIKRGRHHYSLYIYMSLASLAAASEYTEGMRRDGAER